MTAPTPPTGTASPATWFITGISSGIGRHLAEQLLGRGDRVAGTIRRAGSVDDLRAAHGDRLWTAHLDVTSSSDVRVVVDRAFAELGRVDVLVNNAGYGLVGAAEELGDDQVEHQIATNLLGSIHVARAALPHLREQGGGRIIQISSYGGQVATAGASLYNASKFGIEGFMEALQKEVAVFDIGVTIVEPGGARTDFGNRSIALGAPMSAYDGTPAALMRRLGNHDVVTIGDPATMAARIIASAADHPAPLRLVLGSDSYEFLHAAFVGRLASIEGQRQSAASTDVVVDPGPEQ